MLHGTEQAMSRGLPALQKTVLNEIRFDFGDANISATGQLTHEPAFGPTGQINLTVQGWQSLFELAKSLGYVAPNLEDMFFTLLTDLAAQTGSSDTITLPAHTSKRPCLLRSLNLRNIAQRSLTRSHLQLKGYNSMRYRPTHQTIAVALNNKQTSMLKTLGS
jgi:hypothetical protein